MSVFTNKVIAQADIAFEEFVAKLEQETGLALRDLSLVDMLTALKNYAQPAAAAAMSFSLDEPEVTTNKPSK
jgi:hypothetical protein